MAARGDPPAPTSYAATMLAASLQAGADAPRPPRKSAALRPVGDETEDDELEGSPRAVPVTKKPALARSIEQLRPTNTAPPKQSKFLLPSDELEDGDDGEDEDKDDDDDDDDEEDDDDEIADNVIISAPHATYAAQVAAQQAAAAAGGMRPGAHTGLHVQGQKSGTPASSSAAVAAASTPVPTPPVVNVVNDPPGGPYQCPHCVKQFSLKGNREKHVRAIHLLIRAFVCPICGHSSSYKRNLDRHVLNVHHRLKPFHCPDCMRSFSQKTNIRTHLKLVHGVDRPFPRPHSCRQCNMAFDTKVRLRNHTSTHHHGKFAWACTLCGKGYKWRRSLRKHMAQKHKIVSGSATSTLGPGVVIETPQNGADGQVQPKSSSGGLLTTEPLPRRAAAAPMAMSYSTSHSVGGPPASSGPLRKAGIGFSPTPSVMAAQLAAEAMVAAAGSPGLAQTSAAVSTPGISASHQLPSSSPTGAASATTHFDSKRAPADCTPFKQSYVMSKQYPYVSVVGPAASAVTAAPNESAARSAADAAAAAAVAVAAASSAAASFAESAGPPGLRPGPARH